MKNIFTFLLTLILIPSVQAQYDFFDDFESYNLGDYIGDSSPNWTTWSGTTGNNEDVQTTNNNASSGNQSIYFTSSSQNGGPQDVVLPFGEVFDQGDFLFSTNFYVEANSGAYFNFQAETEIGDTWALDCNMNSDGSIVFSNGGGGVTFLSGSYSTDSWFNLKIIINLTLNQWEVFIDNNSIGSFSNPINQVASLDLFPLQGHSFYVDDVMISYTPFNPQGINAILMSLSVPSYVQVPTTTDITGNILNYGAETITSMDIVWTDGTNSFTDNVTGVSIATLESYDFTHSDQISLTELDTVNLSVYIENINGGMDMDTTNNSLDMTIISVPFVTNRLPLYEHFTSNTCGPCASFNPGFQTLLDANNVNQINDAKVGAIKYQVNWPGSADQSYNADVATRVSYYNVDGVPFAHIDGNSAISTQEEIDNYSANPSFLDISGTAVASNGTDLTVEVSVTSYDNLPNATIHIAVVENQYYNNAGTNGETEFFQVMRKMLPDANGTTADLSNGQAVNVSQSASFEIGNVTPDSYNLWEGLGNCIVIAFVQDENTKKVVHAKLIEITGDTTASNKYNSQNLNQILLSPNPALNQISVLLQPQTQSVALDIYSITGERVHSKYYGKLNEEQQIVINIDHLARGIYTLKIQVDDDISVEQFIKQ